MADTLSPSGVKRKRPSQPLADGSNTRSSRIRRSDVPTREHSPHASMAGDLRRLRLYDIKPVRDISTDEQTRSLREGWGLPPSFAELSQLSECASPSPVEVRGRSPNPETTDHARSPAFSAHCSRSPLPDFTLWWSKNELTGQHIDPQDPEDDGEGINGIGFVPTTAIADARAERRRRQVKEWKERENREARVRRGERRRLKEVESEVSNSTGVENAKKVRFIESVAEASAKPPRDT